MASTSLPDLPAELRCAIISYLDPVSLISLSQTSREFRNLINPARHHFVQRLLALELDPKVGGITPLFRGRDNNLSPPWHTAAWDSNLYACCACLKLRLHTLFDNHSILCLRVRKPPPGSEEAVRMQRSDWEPVEGGVNWRRLALQSRQDTAERKEAETQYHRACTGFHLAHLGFEPDDMDVVDVLAEVSERLLAGTHRHKRTCLECRFNRGDWKRPTADLGCPESPIVRSRNLPFPDDFSRNFPGLSPLLDEWPTLFKVYNSGQTTSLYPLFATCCSNCHIWQDFAAFRQYSVLRDANMGPLLCNQCAVAKMGREAFSKEFSAWATVSAHGSFRLSTNRLIFGWDTLRRDFFPELNGSWSTSSLRDYQDVGREIFDGLISEQGSRELILDEDELPLDNLRPRFERFRKFIETEVPAHVTTSILSSWFKLWYDDYHLNEAAYLRMKDVVKRIERDPDWLVDYALEPKRYHLSAFRAPGECSATIAPR